MKAKSLAAAIVLALAFNGGAAAAPTKAVKPIPEAFHGYWVGGKYADKGKKSAWKHISQCSEAENLDILNKKKKSKLWTLEINADRIYDAEYEAEFYEALETNVVPVKYTVYSPNHIAGRARSFMDEGPYGGSDSRVNFNYRIVGGKLYDNKNVLIRCPNPRVAD